MTENLPKLLNGITDWTSFKVAISTSNTKTKGDAFELLTKKYLQSDPVYATKLKTVWLLSELPSELRIKLNLPTTDQGIDLIAETFEGEYWAVQCKYREDGAHNLTWREISTFTGLTFGVCKGISYALLCTSGDRYTNLIKSQDNVGVCTSEVWQNLAASTYELLGQDKVEHVELEPFEPRPHQSKAIANALSYFENAENTRGKLIMPCGAGKSLTSYWITQALEAKTTIIAVPSLALLKQTLRVWLRETVANNVEGLEWICVCSDSTVGEFNDEVAVLPQDLGVPCSTRIDEITDWFKASASSKRRIIFTTYQSGKVIAEASRQSNIVYDLGIMDEAHKTVGQRDALFSHLLFDENVEINKRIFMTATERRYAGSADTIVSMDDPSIYGVDFDLLSFKEALEQNPPILSDYRILTVYVSKSELLELIEKNSFVKPSGMKNWNKEIEADALLSLLAFLKAQQQYPIHHTVSFHSSISRAKAFKENAAQLAPEFASDILPFHVTGATPTSVRQRTINDFSAADNSLITNARCLTEGVDVPNIDCVLFADPKRSTVDIVQAVGRALRPAKGKKYGYVLIPVMVDDTAEITIDENNAFSSILAILRALASNDERIIEQFKSISMGRSRSKGPIIDPVFTAKTAELIEINDFVNNIELRCWDKLAKLSWLPFDEARDFVRSLGLKSQKEWNDYTKGLRKELPSRPLDLPTRPERVYLGQWAGIGDWLGTGTIAPWLREYRSFEEAKAFVQPLNLKSRAEWELFINGQIIDLPPLPDDIPRAPHNTYRLEWQGMGDFLGSGFIATSLREYLPFYEARQFVQSLGLNNLKEWNDYCYNRLELKKPANIPANPQRTYESEWLGFGDWLGTNRKSARYREYRDFVSARKFAHSLKLKSISEWQHYCKTTSSKPDDIPSSPDRVYTLEWQGYGDWLGTGTKQPGTIEYLPYQEAKKYVSKLGIKNQQEWKLYAKSLLPGFSPKPENIPSNPHHVYGEEFEGTGQWLGTGVSRGNFREFKEARAFVHSLKLKSMSEWRLYCKGQLPGQKPKPSDIPNAPNQANQYATQWVSFGDWLGNGYRRQDWRNFEEARDFARSLNLKSTTDWRKYVAGNFANLPPKPEDIPTNPDKAYKGKWINIQDWLGSSSLV